MPGYRELDPARIVETAVTLHKRVAERFPASSLSRVAAELSSVARSADEVSLWLSRPILWVRISVGVAVAILAFLVFVALRVVRLDLTGAGFSETAQGVEAAVNNLVFVAIAIYFLVGIEARIKRARAIKELHVLRSMAHVVDMHQLTKDPERLTGANAGGDTASSPKRDMTPFQLTRYLDYSSELLAILSKIAAIYVQRFNDAEVLRAAGDIEDLTVGLSRNIWQKIMILDRTGGEAG
ncbi:MAG: hypothetical protein EOO73_21170 [Myxococcales bacterium]|nr:MAG: hypothetical protein EOO73_21170 [Myxococcales bacterium]